MDSGFAAARRVVMTIGANCLGLVVFVPMLSRYFIRNRGMAISIVQSANGIARGISAPLVQLLISLIGWRSTYLVQAGLMGVLVLPLAALFRRAEAPPAQLQSGAVPNETPAADAEPLGRGWTLREAVRTPHFWLLFLVYLCTGLGSFFVSLHQLAFAVDIGFDKLYAAEVLGLAPPASAQWLGRFADEGLDRDVAAILDRADRVALHLGSTLAHDDVDRDLRHVALVEALAGTQLRFAHRFRDVAKFGDLEPGGDEVGAHRFRGREKAGVAGRRPGHREIGLARGAGAQIRQCEPPARPQRAERLAVELPLVRDVHDDVLRITGVERAVRHRQRQRAAMDDAHAVAKTGRGVQRLGGGAEFRRQIDAGDMGAVCRGEPARRTANSRADVEDALARLQGELSRDLLRRDDAAPVKMVEWRENVGGYRRIRPLRRAQRGQDTLGDTGAAVMLRDRGRLHRSPPGFTFPRGDATA